MENYYSLTVAAAKLGVSVEAVRRLCHRGTLRHVRWSGRIMVARVEVDSRASGTPHNSRRRAS
jgi:excisionase family DNA binding protein